MTALAIPRRPLLATPTSDLRSVHRPAPDTTRTSYRVARTTNEILGAWNVVYRTYLGAGLIDANDLEVHVVPQSLQPSSAVVVGGPGGAISTTLSCYRDEAIGLPLDAIFHDELNRLRDAGRRLFEVGMLADLDLSPRSPEALFDLMRFAFHYGRYVGDTDMVIGVHPRHARFYQRLVGLEVIGAEREYGLVRGNPAVLLRLDLDSASRMAAPPRGIRYFLSHPVADAVYRHRCRFAPDSMNGSMAGVLRRLIRMAGGGTAAGRNNLSTAA